MRKSTLTALGIAGVAVFGVSLILPTAVSAQAALSADEESSSFIQQLAERLGLSEDTVETAVEEVKEERKAEFQAERQAQIDEAVANGNLTARQAELLAAMQEVRESSTFEKPDRSELEDLTQEERQAFFEEQKEVKKQELVDALNEMGLNTSVEELEELRDTMQELGFDGPRGNRGGPRGGFGRF